MSFLYRTMPSAAEVRELLDYCPDTGAFTWRDTGERADYESSGRRKLQLDGRQHYAHRVAWLHFHGVPPANVIDHVNGTKDDNRIDNLRDVTQGENIRAHYQRQRGEA